MRGFFSQVFFFNIFFRKITCLGETGADLEIAVPARQADQRNVRQPTRPLSRPVAAHLLTTTAASSSEGFHEPVLGNLHHNVGGRELFALADLDAHFNPDMI
jgi:hypothetical protein